MNPETYIHNDLGNICFNKALRSGDKITIYEFDDENQIAMVEFINIFSKDYNLNVNEVLLRYLPNIEIYKKQTYTFIKTEKCRGDRWAILLTEDGEETHINLSEVFLSFYSINSIN
jgi:hypothetical protein